MTGNAYSEHVKLTATMSPMQKNRALNDSFRKTAKGGIVTISMGIHMLGRVEVENIMKRLGVKWSCFIGQVCGSAKIHPG